MLKRFVGVWILYWAIVAVLPVASIYPATNEALLVQLSFVCLVALTSVGVLSACNSSPIAQGGLDSFNAGQLISISLILSVLGLVALGYDKIVLQGIDFSQGLAAARVQWSNLAAAREGRPSSLFSVIGYLLGSSYFVATALVIKQGNSASLRQHWAVLVTCFFLALANSALTGGRSILLLWVVFLIAALALAKSKGRRSVHPFPLLRIWPAAFAAFALAYVLFIFYQRAQLSGVGRAEYAMNFLPFLGLRPAPWYAEWVRTSPFGDLSAILVLSVSYVSHSFATVAAIVDTPSGGNLLFVHILDILYKLGIADRPETAWFLAGRLPSVPGALWHEFGPCGLIVGSVSLGAACALTQVWYVQHPARILPIGLYLAAEVTLVLSPAVLAFDLLAFPFVLMGFAILALAHSLWPASRQPSYAGI